MPAPTRSARAAGIPLGSPMPSAPRNLEIGLKVAAGFGCILARLGDIRAA